MCGTNFTFSSTTNVRARYSGHPENYTVWYEYFAQSNLDLNRAIDGFLANNVVFTKEVNTSLYKNFIQEKSPEVIENVQIETQILINSLISKITQLNQGTESFSSTLADFGLQLNHHRM